MDNNYQEPLIKLLLTQIKERDEILKLLSENIIKLSDAYIIKDKEKDKRHMKTILGVIAMCLIASTVTMGIFICSYFYAPYTDHSVISGNNNATVIGDSNSNNKIKDGGEK